MDLKLWNTIAAVLVVVCLGTSALSLPQGDLLSSDDKIEPQSSDVDERATWLDTRGLESEFKEHVYLAIQELAMEGKLSATLLKAPGLTSKDKRNRWQGFCFRRTKSGRYLPYICWKGKGKK